MNFYPDNQEYPHISELKKLVNIQSFTEWHRDEVPAVYLSFIYVKTYYLWLPYFSFIYIRTWIVNIFIIRKVSWTAIILARITVTQHFHIIPSLVQTWRRMKSKLRETLLSKHTGYLIVNIYRLSLTRKLNWQRQRFLNIVMCQPLCSWCTQLLWLWRGQYLFHQSQEWKMWLNNKCRQCSAVSFEGRSILIPRSNSF